MTSACRVCSQCSSSAALKIFCLRKSTLLMKSCIGWAISTGRCYGYNPELFYVAREGSWLTPTSILEHLTSAVVSASPMI